MAECIEWAYNYYFGYIDEAVWIITPGATPAASQYRYREIVDYFMLGVASASS